ncbi:hypothetical protein [Chitinophaga silvatica]|uniref:hypothetical protein n=1 Tax=Chitinophaga silvatica TaxID=2282649 RepID=UPI0013149E71|nr:hypothetical protein [Chitinophaga silvatica]
MKSQRRVGLAGRVSRKNYDENQSAYGIGEVNDSESPIYTTLAILTYHITIFNE